MFRTAVLGGILDFNNCRRFVIDIPKLTRILEWISSALKNHATSLTGNVRVTKSAITWISSTYVFRKGDVIPKLRVVCDNVLVIETECKPFRPRQSRNMSVE